MEPSRVVLFQEQPEVEAKMGVLDYAHGVHGIGHRSKKMKHGFSVTQHIEDNLGRC